MPLTLDVRRVVTGHDDDGNAVFRSDEVLSGSPVLHMRNESDSGAHSYEGSYLGRVLWATTTMPVDNSEAAGPSQGRGVDTVTVGNGQGTVLRIGVLAPGNAAILHRTESVDYAILLSGECDIELDSGERMHLKAGDVVIQRGTNHIWLNNGTEPCRFAWILIDANPVSIGGKVLGNFTGEATPRRGA